MGTFVRRDTISSAYTIITPNAGEWIAIPTSFAWILGVPFSVIVLWFLFSHACAH